MDPTLWLDGARPPPKYIWKNSMSSTNSKIDPTWTQQKFYQSFNGQIWEKEPTSNLNFC